MESVIMASGLKVDFNGTEYEVKALPIRKYKTLIEKVAEVMDLSDLKALLSDDAGSSGQALRKFAEAPEKLASICEIATGIPAEKVLDGNLEQVLDLIVATVKVNNLLKVFTEALKKIKGPAEEKVEAKA